MKNKLSRLYYKLLTPEKKACYLKEKGILNIGVDCEIYDDVSFGSEPYLIKIGKKVRITSGVRLVTHDGGMWVTRNLNLTPNADKMGRIIIGDNVFIGLNSIIMPGVTIGSNVIIGAGSIVSRDIENNSVVAGIPAKFICDINDYYEKNRKKIFETKHLSFKEKKKFYSDVLL